ncbi:MAG: DUF6551 family protein [Nocardioides sp.]
MTKDDTNLLELDIDAALDDILEPPGTADQATTRPDRPDPYVDALPVDNLFADHTYQRELDTHRVAKMATDFKIALVGIIEVSRRGPRRYAILDGQHRWATIRDVAFSDTQPRHVACRVHLDLTIPEEAKLYAELNTTRRQLTGWDRWLARRAAHEPAVVAIEAAAHRHGYSVGMTTGPGILRATKACENVVALNGIGLLDTVLSTVKAAYGDDQAGLDAAILYSLGHIHHAYTNDELDARRLVDTLTGIVPRQLTARAAAVRELHKGTMDRLTGHVIVERYNQTKGTGRRLEPFLERVKPLSQVAGERTRVNAQIRAWAQREGIELPPKVIPTRVRSAYAHRNESAPT